MNVIKQVLITYILSTNETTYAIADETPHLPDTTSYSTDTQCANPCPEIDPVPL